MKKNELIIEIVGFNAPGPNQVDSILNKNNLEKLGFKVIQIGSKQEGFNFEDLEIISQCAKSIEHINIILNCHGNYGQIHSSNGAHVDYYKLQMTNEMFISGHTIIDEINKQVNLEVVGLEPKKKLNIILTSCYGNHIHNNITKMDSLLADESKIISLSGLKSATVVADFLTNKIDLLSKIFIENNLCFMDLAKLYCVGKHSSENVPVLGVQGQEGYKTISFEMIVQNLIKKSVGEITFSGWLNSLFKHNILSKDIMNKLIEKSSNFNDWSSIKMPNTIEKMAQESIKSNTTADLIKKLSGEYYSGQSLDCITFSRLTTEDQKTIDYFSKKKISSPFALQEPETFLDEHILSNHGYLMVLGSDHIEGSDFL